MESKYIDRENDFCRSRSALIPSVGLFPLSPSPLTGFIVINYLSVLPAYQRLGLVRPLLYIGLDEADELGASTFLVATEVGAGLYRKAGFQEIESFTIDIRPCGGESKTVWRSMRREPARRTSE